MENLIQLFENKAQDCYEEYSRLKRMRLDLEAREYYGKYLAFVQSKTLVSTVVWENVKEMVK